MILPSDPPDSTKLFPSQTQNFWAPKTQVATVWGESTFQHPLRSSRDQSLVALSNHLPPIALVHSSGAQNLMLISPETWCRTKTPAAPLQILTWNWPPLWSNTTSPPTASTYVKEQSRVAPTTPLLLPGNPKVQPRPSRRLPISYASRHSTNAFTDTTLPRFSSRESSTPWPTTVLVSGT